MKKRTYLAILLVFTVFTLSALLFGCSLFGGGGDGDTTWNGEKVALKTDDFIYSPEGKSYTYRGTEITVENDITVKSPTGSKVPNKQFDFTYENNLNVGTATVTVTPNSENEYYTGSVKFNYQIVKGAVVVTNVTDLIRELNGDNVSSVTIYGNVDLGEANVTVKEGVTLNIGTTDLDFTFTVGGKLTNNGIINLMQTRSAYNSVDFVNDGTVINNGEIHASLYTDIFNGGVFENNGTFVMEHTVYSIYSNDKEIPNVEEFTGTKATQHIRTRITEDKVTLQYKTIAYTQGKKEYKPTVSIEKPSASFVVGFATEYKNYDRAGDATVDIKISKKDHLYYGEVTVGYTIEKGSVTVENPREIEEYQASGNFGTFNADTFVIPEGESFTLEEGMTLRAHNVYIYGAFINKGNVVAYSEPNGAFYTQGFVYVNMNNEGAGNFDNRGTVDTEYLSILMHGNVINSGTVTATASASLQSPVLNTATGKLYFDCDVNFYGEFTNEGEVYITPSNYALIANGYQNSSVVINKGYMKIDGELVCRTFDGFENTGTIENTGGVWLDLDTLPTGLSNVVVKRQITKEDFVITNSGQYYDGTVKHVQLADSAHLQDGQYIVKYYLDGQDTAVEPINAGVMTLFVQITSDFTPYFKASSNTDPRGILSRDEGITYEILFAQHGITNAQDLYDYCGNSNYNRLYLTNDVTFTSATATSSLTSKPFTTRFFRIAEGVVLDTNGYTLTIRGDGNDSSYVNNYGTILNSKVGNYPVDYKPTSLEDFGIVLVDSGKIYNYGKIVNNNLIYVEKDSNLYEEKDYDTDTGMSVPLPGVVVENHGLMYLTSDIISYEGDENRERIFVRRNLYELRANREIIDLEYWTVDYDETEKEPTIFVKGISANADTERFTVKYNSNINAGSATANVTVKDKFDREFYGYAFVTFNILKSVKQVSTQSELVNAVNNDNYYGYEAVAPFSVTQKIVLKAGTRLDLGIYDLTFTQYDMIDLSSGAELWVSVNSMSRFQTYALVADRLIFVEDINTETTTSVNLSSSANMGKVGNYKPFTKVYDKITVDLNGHFVGGRIEWTNNYEPHVNTTNYYVLNITDTSEEMTGQLGSGTTDHGLYIVGNKSITVNLTNVKIGGMQLDKSVTLTANNCHFITTATEGNARAAYYNVYSGNNVHSDFTKCTFEGVTGAYLGYATHTFKSCNFIATGDYVYGVSGSGIIVNLTTSGGVKVNVDGGNISATNGYCMEILGVIETNHDIKITQRTTINNFSNWSCGKASKIYGPYYVVESLS